MGKESLIAYDFSIQQTTKSTDVKLWQIPTGNRAYFLNTEDMSYWNNLLQLYSIFHNCKLDDIL